jgi:hypothetical protein
MLGGAAVRRCDKRLLFSPGFSRWGRLRRSSRVFQLTLLGGVSYAARLSCVKPFSRRTSVKNLFLTRLVCSWRADRSSARIVSNSPALRAATARWQSSRILSSSRLVNILHPKQFDSNHGSAACGIPHTLYFARGKGGASWRTNIRRLPPKLNRASATDLQQQRKRTPPKSPRSW